MADEQLPSQGTHESPMVTRTTMSPAEWVKVISQLLTLIVGMGGVTALWGIRTNQSGPANPIPVVPVVSPNSPVVPAPNVPNPVVPPVVPTFATKDDVTKALQESEKRIIDAISDKLKAFDN